MSQMPQRSMMYVFRLSRSLRRAQTTCVQMALMAGSSIMRAAMVIRRGVPRVPSAMGPATVLAEIRTKAAQKDATWEA